MLKTFCLIIISLLFISACSISVDDQELSALEGQLEAAYEACENDGIDDLDSLEAALNNGGQNLSKSCRTALAIIDFQGVVNSFSISLNFEIPSPSDAENPFRDQSSSWQAMTQWISTSNNFYFSTGLDTNDPNNIIVEGVDATGNLTAITPDIAALSASEIAISYTTDYSGSMLEDDIIAVSAYYQDIHAAMPTNYSGRVDIFSDMVTNKTAFTTTSSTLNSALAHDPDYERSLTALYDAWNTAITALNTRAEKVKINILTTDGYENNSTISITEITDAVQNSDVFNIIIASGWAEVDELKNIVGDKGFVIYKYQIDEAQTLIADLKNALDDINIVTVSSDVSAYDELRVSYQGETKLTLPLP